MKKNKSIIVELPDNQMLSVLVGPQDKHLSYIEEFLDISLALRGNKIFVEGSESSISQAREIIKCLYDKVKCGNDIGLDEVSAVLRTYTDNSMIGEVPTIATRKRIITARSKRQAIYMNMMSEKDMVFGVGPAGTGKTYLAAAHGISLLLEGKVERVILSRPAVEAGEKLGFLPGDMKEKVDPYLRPLYDALHDMLPPDQIEKRITSGEIEIAPLAFMRGRTLASAFIILDEAQNTTKVQMKMFLTRLGNYSHMVINGDLSQVDLPKGVTSGLADALDYLSNINDIGVVRFNEEDVVRHPLVGKIVKAYAEK